MTQEQFNEKYKQYIPEGWYGLGFDIPEVTIYLDEVMQDLITIPGFELHQIKVKFGMSRFYFGSKWNSAHLETAMQYSIENRINYFIGVKYNNFIY